MSTDLYTSQVHLKRLLAGQATAAFTPVPVDVAKLIDPAFVPGMGAFNEDEQGRLQCPMRGCGEWHHRLGAHLATSHKRVGGAKFVRRALGVPGRVPLTSARERDAARARGLTGVAANPALRGKPKPPVMRAKSAWAKNVTDTCTAQVAARFSELAREIGHPPTIRQFGARYGFGVAKAVRRVFGSWSAAKSLFASRDGSTPEPPVLSALLGWYLVHGDLPLATDIADPEAWPILPSYAAILRALQVNNWPAAMRSAVERLGLNSAQYGSPSIRLSA